MSSHQGWIKLHRAVLDWQWFGDPNTTHVFMYCLLKANHKDNMHRDTLVKRGTFLTGRDLISRETGCSVREVRTALKRLESANVLTSKTSCQGTVIEVLNYDRYQQIDQQNDQQATNERPTNDQQATSNKNDKKEKNDKNTLSDDVPPPANGVDDLFGEVDTPPAKPARKQAKKQAKQFVPPSREEFIAYAIEKLPTLNPDWDQERSTRCAAHRFDTYVDQDWHDGHGKPIQNWKTKSIAAMKHDSPRNFGSNPQFFADQRKLAAEQSNACGP